jgi:hypothetical protein
MRCGPKKPIKRPWAAITPVYRCEVGGREWAELEWGVPIDQAIASHEKTWHDDAPTVWLRLIGA